jgi:hypothetical protein
MMGVVKEREIGKSIRFLSQFREQEMQYKNIHSSAAERRLKVGQRVAAV